jgi:hypothetical protein
MTLDAEQRRALDLLAGSARGLTNDFLLAHGFAVEMLAGLVCDGLASPNSERVRFGGRTIEVPRLLITDEGRKALAQPE